MKIFKASIRIYLSQIAIVIISLVLMVALFSMTQNHPYLFSAITSLIYLASMYSLSWHIGRCDSRKIPGFYPDRRVPAAVAAITSVLPIVLLVIRLAAPWIWHIDIPFVNGEYDFFLSGCRVEGTPDMIYRLWFFPFAAFVPEGNIGAYIAELFVLPVLIFAGYFVGLTRFSVFEYLYMKLVFSNKNDSKKENKVRR